MQYVFKNKFLSLKGSSTIKDVNGVDRFILKGKFFTFTKKKRLMDLDKNLLFTIQNKFFTWFLPKVYIKNPKGKIICTLKKEKIFSFKRNFVIINNEIDCKIQGDFFSLTSNVLINNQVVGVIRRQIDFLVDSFIIDVIDENYTNFILALVTAIDNFYDDYSNSKN